MSGLANHKRQKEPPREQDVHATERALSPASAPVQRRQPHGIDARGPGKEETLPSDKNKLLTDFAPELFS